MPIQAFQTHPVKERHVIINEENIKVYVVLQDSVSHSALKGIEILGQCFRIQT